MKQLSHNEFDRKTHKLSIQIICDELQSAANLGTIFRSAEAFGVSGIYIHEANEAFLNQPRFIKSSRHTFRSLKVNTYLDRISLIESLKKENYQIISLEQCDQSKALQDVEFRPKTVIIVGNENNGIYHEFLQESDAVAHINMYGKNSSMNVSQALAIGLYECIRQQV